jgi:hypothetical protein
MPRIQPKIEGFCQGDMDLVWLCGGRMIEIDWVPISGLVNPKTGQPDWADY